MMVEMRQARNETSDKTIECGVVSYNFKKGVDSEAREGKRL